MDPVRKAKYEIEELIGISGSDADVFWALSKKCAGFALVPTIAAGAKWGPGLVAAGTMTIPGLGTMSGATATLIMMGGVWSASYGACMSLLPGLLKYKQALQQDNALLTMTRQDIRGLLAQQRMTSRA